jgi:histidinol-phosphate aminotransferase
MLARREFLRTMGAGAAGAFSASVIGARGREHSIWSGLEPPLHALEPGIICLASNENPLGPGTVVLDAVRAAFGANGAQAGRYSGGTGALIEAIAGKLKVKPENVVLGCGSTQILRSATHLFTAKEKPLVGTIPTYEECVGYAELMGHPVRTVPLDTEFSIDLDAFARAARGAGLVFYCNPNNPTATYIGAKATREFLARVNRDSPDTTILVDEAYYEYVTDPDHDTHVPIAVENPRVLVARTFSKAYGMAGLRIGYAVGHKDTIKKMADWDGGSGTSSLNVLALHGALAAIQQDSSVTTAERTRNLEVREFTKKWFADRGMQPTDSQANFMFVNLGRPVRGFRDACRKNGVLVARDFPPFENTHCRVSFGTMEEMRKAVVVFDQALRRAAA